MKTLLAILLLSVSNAQADAFEYCAELSTAAQQISELKFGAASQDEVSRFLKDQRLSPDVRYDANLALIRIYHDPYFWTVAPAEVRDTYFAACMEAK